MERGAVVENDNRSFPRADVNEPVKILLDNSDHPMDAIATNISIEGILLQSEFHLELNFLVRLYLSNELGNMNVVAKLIWQQNNNFYLSTIRYILSKLGLEQYIPCKIAF